MIPRALRLLACLAPLALNAKVGPSLVEELMGGCSLRCAFPGGFSSSAKTRSLKLRIRAGGRINGQARL